MPTSWQDLKTKRLDAMSAAERAEYDRAYAAAKLAAEVGVGATLTTLQRVASALGLTVSVDLKQTA